MKQTRWRVAVAFGLMIAAFGVAACAAGAEQVVQAHESLSAQQQALDDAALSSGKMTAFDWRTRYHERLKVDAAFDSGVYMGEGGSHETPRERALLAVGTVIANASPNGQNTNWNAVDRWMQDELTPDIGTSAASTATVAQYLKASTELGAAGYFNLSATVWAKQQTANPKLVGQDFNKIIQDDTVQALAYFKSKGVGDERAKKLATNYVAHLPTIAAHSYMLTVARRQWVAANPQLAQVTSKWGYLQPTAQEQILIDEANAAAAHNP